MEPQPAPQLTDTFRRDINYLRLSVTDRCNLRCLYCMDEQMQFLPRHQLLSLEEIKILTKTFVELGIQKIRITGGEPLIRQGIVSLCDYISQLDNLKELVMTTNGVLLKQFAQPLKTAGVSRLNISIDSLNANQFRKMTRNGNLSQVLEGIASAQKAGYQRIRLNIVVLKSLNSDEVLRLVHFALQEGLDAVFIEEMPLGLISSHSRATTQMDSLQLLNSIGEHYSLTPEVSNDSLAGPARYYQVAGYTNKIGFISPISNNFCPSCNRIRLTANGNLLLCLGNEHSVNLRALVQEQPNNTQLLKQTIIRAMASKPERHFFTPEEVTILRFMNTTGG